MTRINVNLSRNIHEGLKIYATRKNLNLDEAAEELLSKALKLNKEDVLITFGKFKREDDIKREDDREDDNKGEINSNDNNILTNK